MRLPARFHLGTLCLFRWRLKSSPYNTGSPYPHWPSRYGPSSKRTPVIYSSTQPYNIAHAGASTVSEQLRHSPILSFNRPGVVTWMVSVHALTGRPPVSIEAPNRCTSGLSVSRFTTHRCTPQKSRCTSMVGTETAGSLCLISVPSKCPLVISEIESHTRSPI